MRPVVSLAGRDWNSCIFPIVEGTTAYTSVASSVISVLFANSFEIGQPALAPAAASSNTSLVAPGTLAVVVSAILVIANPPSTLASVTAA